MPIREYRCEKCATEFEELVFKEQVPSCPKCGENQVTTLMSCCQAKTGDGFIASSGTSGASCGSCSGGHCASCH